MQFLLVRLRKITLKQINLELTNVKPEILTLVETDCIEEPFLYLEDYIR